MLMIAAGIYGRTHVGPLARELESRIGHSPHLFWTGQWHRSLTSILFTGGRLKFYVSLSMLVFSVGWLEITKGPVVAAMTFVGVHLATLMIMSIGIALSTALRETHRGNLLWYVTDVGPSAGYYGCLGAALVNLGPNFQLPVFAAICLVLAARCGWSSYHLPENGQVMSADIAHAIAFPLGFMISKLIT